MGVGPNRINDATITESAQGLSNFLKKKGKEGKMKAVIAFDTRKNSKRFAWIAANVFAANGIDALVLIVISVILVIAAIIAFNKRN